MPLLYGDEGTTSSRDSRFSIVDTMSGMSRRMLVCPFIKKFIEKLKEVMKESQNIWLWKPLAAIRLRECLKLSGKQKV